MEDEDTKQEAHYSFSYDSNIELMGYSKIKSILNMGETYNNSSINIIMISPTNDNKTYQLNGIGKIKPSYNYNYVLKRKYDCGINNHEGESLRKTIQSKLMEQLQQVYVYRILKLQRDINGIKYRKYPIVKVMLLIN